MSRPSDDIARTFRERDHKNARRVIEHTRTMPAPAATVFAQLCPTREHDWIEGWAAELIHTESGYAEEGCVFRTGDDNATGPGVWVVSHHEPPSLLKIVRVMAHVVVHLVVAVADLGDGTSSMRWTVAVTALDEIGEAAVRGLPEGDALVAKTAEKLERFLVAAG